MVAVQATEADWSELWIVQTQGNVYGERGRYSGSTCSVKFLVDILGIY